MDFERRLERLELGSKGTTYTKAEIDRYLGMIIKSSKALVETYCLELKEVTGDKYNALLIRYKEKMDRQIFLMEDLAKDKDVRCKGLYEKYKQDIEDFKTCVAEMG